MTAVKTSLIESDCSVCAQAEKSFNLPFCLMNQGGAQYCSTELPCFLPLRTECPPISQSSVKIKKDKAHHESLLCEERCTYFNLVMTIEKQVLVEWFRPCSRRFVFSFPIGNHRIRSCPTWTFKTGKDLDWRAKRQTKFKKYISSALAVQLSAWPL